MFGFYLKEKNIFVIGGVNEQNEFVDFDFVYLIFENFWIKVDYKGEMW